MRRAREAGVVAIKLYPAGATTNSAAGVTDLKKVAATLAAAEKEGIVLLVHGEVTDPDVDIFDREAVFIDRHLHSAAARLPGAEDRPSNTSPRARARSTSPTRPRTPPRRSPPITCSTTATRSSSAVCGPHYYCLPVLKGEEHRRALVAAATSRQRPLLPRHRQRAASGRAQGACQRLRRLLHRVQRARALRRSVRRSTRARPPRAVREPRRAGLLRPAAQRGHGHAAEDRVDAPRVAAVRRGRAQAAACRRIAGLAPGELIALSRGLP